MTGFRLRSPAFEDGKVMATKYAHQGVVGGRNISVPLKWEGSPPETRSFALACVDLHPVANRWVHWLIVNIPADSGEFEEGASLTASMPHGSKELNNTFGDAGYGGPEPPKGSGPHRYEFTLYALTLEKLDTSPNTSLSGFLKGLEGRVAGAARTVGVFER